MLVFKALHNLLPAYLVLVDVCQLVSVTGRQQLHLSDIGACLAQRSNTRLGDYSFAAAWPRIWHSLPTQLWESDITLGQCRRAPKTHLFGHWQRQHWVTVFFVCCVQNAYLLTYLVVTYWPLSALFCCLVGGVGGYLSCVHCCRLPANAPVWPMH